jgi:Fic family protein
LLDGDWVTFEFDYCLDLQALVPHIVAIKSYQEAAYTRVLPRRWLGTLDPVSGAEDTHSPDLLAGQPSQQNQVADTHEAFQIKNAAAATARAWARERFFPGSAPLSLDDILTMHRMISSKSTVDYNRPGTLRSLPVQVGRIEVGGVHMGAPAGKLPFLMEQYIQFINSKKLTSLPPVVHALLAHFFFDTLHPFDDGNGRMSRLVAAAILFQHGYNVQGGYGLSNYFYQNDIQYHTLLQRAWRRCPFDLTPFVAFGMEGLVVELKSINSFIKMKLNRIVDRETTASTARKRMGWRRGQWV